MSSTALGAIRKKERQVFFTMLHGDIYYWVYDRTLYMEEV